VMEAATVGEGGARRDSYRSLLQVPRACLCCTSSLSALSAASAPFLSCVTWAGRG
jgi:hypothetical protein